MTFGLKIDVGFCEFNIKCHEHFTLGCRSFIERVEVLVKELVRNKINFSWTSSHYPNLKGLIPGLLEKG